MVCSGFSPQIVYLTVPYMTRKKKVFVVRLSFFSFIFFCFKLADYARGDVDWLLHILAKMHLHLFLVKYLVALMATRIFPLRCSGSQYEILYTLFQFRNSSQ